MPPGLSRRRRQRIHLWRAISIVVLALDFWHDDGFPNLDLLGRAPNPVHQCLYRRIESLIRAEGPFEMKDILVVGRRFPQLLARLSELSDALTELGPSCNPYDKFFPGRTVDVRNEVLEELVPFRDLCPERLKISGTASWDPSPFLTEEFYMAFRDPYLIKASRLPEVGTYPQCRDSPSSVGHLARLWDVRGLLFIHDGREYEPFSAKTLFDCPHDWIKVFNCYKSELVDRQIGDRRGANYRENRIEGPSLSLPSGTDLVDIYVNPSEEYLATAVTDRKDYYHQLRCSRRKTLANSVGPPVPVEEVEGTKAYSEFLLRQAQKKKPRHIRGDWLHGEDLKKTESRSDEVFVAFRGVLQGDHLGVDVATCAHKNFLKEQGLLSYDSTVEATRPLLSQDLCEGLCTDDYFVVSKQKSHVPLQETKAAEKVRTANAAYEREGSLGSPEKDILARKAKAVGATINASEESCKRGLVTLAAPIEKRIGLALITLHLCQLTHTTDSLHLYLLGGWVSAILYRRPIMSILDKSFGLVDAASTDPDCPKLVPLTRGVANELVLLAVLMPLLCADLSADYHSEVFCSDASDEKGAFCSAMIDRRIHEILWKSSKSKGAYTRILLQEKPRLRSLKGKMMMVPRWRSLAEVEI